MDYDLFGRTSQIRHANGVLTSLHYDDVTGQVRGQKVTGPQGQILRDQSYDYDDEHRLIGIGMGAGAPADETGWAYSFDGLGRLASAAPSAPSAPAAGPGRLFTYSDGGNMLTGPLGQAQTYVPGTSRLATAGGDAYGYDAAGRMTSAPWGTATWDAEDHLLGVVSAASTVQHVYDHTGARVMSREDGAVYHLRVSEELAFFDGGATLFVSFAGAPIATVDETGAVRWLHQDVLGDVTLVTDAAGAVARRITLDPWGNKLGSGTGPGSGGGTGAGTAEPPGSGFLGMVTDPTGLICLGHRWYDPRTGRFLSPDPMAGGLYTVGAWNAYSYGMNNPVLTADPSGLTSIWTIIALAVVVALIVVLAVATCGAALAGVTVLGVTFAAAGASTGTLIAVGIGAFGGALAGAMAADQKGGDIMLGALVGGIIGGATRADRRCHRRSRHRGDEGLRHVGRVRAVPGRRRVLSAVSASGLRQRLGRRQGQPGRHDAQRVRGMIWGATIGMVMGGFLGGKFASSGEQHSYLEVGTLHKYGVGFAAESTDLSSDFTSGTTTSGPPGTSARRPHADDGTFSAGSDLFGNVIDVSTSGTSARTWVFHHRHPGHAVRGRPDPIADSVAINGGAAGLDLPQRRGRRSRIQLRRSRWCMMLKGVPILGQPADRLRRAWAH